MSKLHTLLLSGSLALGTMIAHAGVANADVRNIVLVHGANVDGTTWRDVYDRLTAQDYTVTVAQLPLTSVQDDIAAVQRNLDALDGPVLLVGHSYGGVVISEAGMDADLSVRGCAPAVTGCVAATRQSQAAQIRDRQRDSGTSDI